MTNPLVSVIIPVYNADKYIAETLESCIKQTYDNIEIIVVNDGSKDSGEDVILSFSDSRIKYFKIENSGSCEARNYGISKASGELFQFLDHDDVLDINKIKIQISQYNRIKQLGKNFIFSGEMGTISSVSKVKDAGYELYEKDFTPIEYFDTVMNQFGKYITTGVWLVPSILIYSTGGWDKNAGLNDDGEYFMRLICNSDGIIFCKSALFYFRREVEGSLSKQRNRQIIEGWLYSYKSYAKTFLQTFEYKQELAKNLAWKGLSKFYCATYPKHPDLLKQCKDDMRKLGYNQPAPYGGIVFVKISHYVGTMSALRLYWLIRKVKQLIAK
jgi:glycosyltransferase involved in cell wall biosynthesis